MRAEIVKHAWLANKKFITRLIIITNCEEHIKRNSATQTDSVTFSKERKKERKAKKSLRTILSGTVPSRTPLEYWAGSRTI